MAIISKNNLADSAKIVKAVLYSLYKVYFLKEVLKIAWGLIFGYNFEVF